MEKCVANMDNVTQTSTWLNTNVNAVVVFVEDIVKSVIIASPSHVKMKLNV
jgi:hypothetical protein